MRAQAIPWNNIQRHVGAIRLPDEPLPRLKAGDVALLVEADRPSTVSNWRLCMTASHRIEVQEPAAVAACDQTCTAA